MYTINENWLQIINEMCIAWVSLSMWRSKCVPCKCFFLYYILVFALKQLTVRSKWACNSASVLNCDPFVRAHLALGRTEVQNKSHACVSVSLVKFHIKNILCNFMNQIYMSIEVFCLQSYRV